MIKFIPISDIHCEFAPMDTSVFYQTQDDVLVIAGDFFTAGKWSSLVSHMTPFAEKFKHVIFVLGNHDYWGGSIVTTAGRYKQELSVLPNVHVLERDSIVIDGVAFIGATFWTDFDNHSPFAKWNAQQMMGDYKRIRAGTFSNPYAKKLWAYDIVVEHVNAKVFIEAEVLKQKAAGNKVVVVTHHAPSQQSKMSYISDTDPLNPCYCNNLDYWVETIAPDFWIHGHIHESKCYKIGNTTVIANPRGYDPFELNEEFEPNYLWTV